MKRITEIKSQPVLILAANGFLKYDELEKLERQINDRLKASPDGQAIILPGIVKMDGWQYGRVETITEIDGQEVLAELEEVPDYAQAEDAAGTAGNL